LKTDVYKSIEYIFLILRWALLVSNLKKGKLFEALTQTRRQYPKLIKDREILGIDIQGGMHVNRDPNLGEFLAFT
jgi:hypothetical protein